MIAKYIKSKSSVKKKQSSITSASKILQGIQLKQLIHLFLFLGFGVIVIFISFLGQKIQGQKLILKEEAKERTVADFSFQYESQIAAEELARNIRTKTPPIYIKSDQALDAFESFLDALENAYTRYDIQRDTPSNDELSDRLKAALNAIIESSNYSIDPSIIHHLYTETSTKERYKLFNDGLAILKNLYRDGIYEQSNDPQANVETVLLQLKNQGILNKNQCTITRRRIGSIKNRNKYTF